MFCLCSPRLFTRAVQYGRLRVPQMQLGLALGEPLTVDLAAVLLLGDFRSACAFRLAVPAPLLSATADADLMFPDSAGRPVDALDYAIAQALTEPVPHPASETPGRGTGLAGTIELAAPLPPLLPSVADDEEATPAASSKGTLVCHARPLLPSRARRPDST